MNRNFYICSVGEPGEDYVEQNLERIISNTSFYMHQNTTQKGLYYSIEKGDILILKYNSNYVAYGESLGNRDVNDEEGWSLTSPVKKWYFLDKNNLKKGVVSYGVQWETMAGSGQMGTVKGITNGFGFKKIEEISNNNELYHLLFNETEKGKMKRIENLLNYKKTNHLARSSRNRKNQRSKTNCKRDVRSI